MVVLEARAAAVALAGLALERGRGATPSQGDGQGLVAEAMGAAAVVAAAAPQEGAMEAVGVAAPLVQQDLRFRWLPTGEPWELRAAQVR